METARRMSAPAEDRAPVAGACGSFTPSPAPVEGGRGPPRATVLPRRETPRPGQGSAPATGPRISPRPIGARRPHQVLDPQARAPVAAEDIEIGRGDEVEAGAAARILVGHVEGDGLTAGAVVGKRELQVPLPH